MQGSYRTSGHSPSFRSPQLRPTLENVAHPPQSSLSELTRDKDLWFEDGSVILIARKTAFKVYKGLLSTHSPVFAGMFSSATHADETDDGCPVVHVSDSPRDLKWLLTHLIPKSLPHMDDDHFRIFRYAELSALARLAHKYQIDVAERYAIGRPNEVFTNDFDVWEREVYVFSESSIAFCNPIDAIHLARLTDTPSILPLAFYICAQDMDLVVGGQKREDSDGAPMMLSNADVKRCIAGYGELCRMSEPMLQQTFLAASPASSCESPSECKQALKRMVKHFSLRKILNHLTTWEPHIEEEFDGCDACTKAAIERDKAARRELWRKLP